MHPDDIVLFDYVEGDLPAPQRAELDTHLGSCALCAEQVARVQEARDALRQAQLLELPASRRAAILASLPARRAASRRPQLSLKRFVAVLTPVAAVAAAVAALVSTDAIDTGGGGGEEAAAVSVSGDSRAMTEATAPAAGGGREGKDQAQSALLFGAGPADALAADLRASGLDAEVVGKHVEVRNASRAEVRRALRGRRDGSVRIIIVR